MVIIPAFLLALGFNLFASNKNKIPWIRKPPKVTMIEDSVSTGTDVTPADTLPLLTETDTGLSADELEQARQDSALKEKQRIQDSINLAKTDSLKALEELNFGLVKNGEALGVTTKKTKEIFDKKKAAFIDARRADQFAKGHIPGSIHIYASEFAENIPKVASIPKDKLLVVYCDGGLCELSHELADELVQFGFKRVVIYTGGWEEWSKTNYPKTTGE